MLELHEHIVEWVDITARYEEQALPNPVPAGVYNDDRSACRRRQPEHGPRYYQRRSHRSLFRDDRSLVTPLTPIRKTVTARLNSLLLFPLTGQYACCIMASLFAE